MCPWYILLGRRQGSRGRWLLSRAGSWRVAGRAARLRLSTGRPGYRTQAGERAAGRAARCGAVLHAGAERARARGRGAGLSASAVPLAAPLQHAGPVPHSLRRSRGCSVPSRLRPDASPRLPPPQLPSAGRAPPSGPRSRREPLARRARSRGAGGGRAAPASALPDGAPLALPGGSEKEE